MSVSVGTAYLEIVPSAKGFVGKLQGEVGGSMGKAGENAGERYSSGMRGRIGKLAKGVVAPIAGLMAADKVKDFFASSIDEARESQKVGALTTQVIKSTGGAAKISASQVGDLATAISNKTGIDDEAVQSGANLLLTFKNVKNEAGKGNDVFNQSTQIMTDMASAMGKEPKAAAIQLGKALNDPVKGITALSKVGVTFSEGQKKQIKTLVASGNTMGAQKIILKELKSEFGGAAAAQATAGEKASVAWGNFKEQIGTALLPVIDKLETVLSTKIIPAVSGFVTGIQEGTGAGGRFREIVERVVKTVSSVVSWIIRWRDVLIPIAAVIGTIVVGWRTYMAVTRAVAAAQLLLNTVMSANPIGLVVIAIAALAAGLIIAYKRSATFRAIVNAAMTAVKTVVMGVVNWFKNSFIPFFTKTLPNAFQTVLNFVRSHWKLILGLITGPVGAAVILVATHWSQIKHAFSSAVAWVKGAFAKSWSVLKTILLAPVKAGQWWIEHYIAAVKKVFTTAWSWASTVFRKSWAGWQKLLSYPINLAKSAINREINGVKTIFRTVWSWASGTFRKSWAGWQSLMTKPVTAARDAIKSALGWGKNGIQSIFSGAVKGIGKIWDGLKKVMTTPLNAVMSLIESFAHAVGKIPGLGSLKKIHLPRFGDGGSVANGGGHALPARANGGSIPGPWRGPTADNVLGISDRGTPVARVNPGEWITRVSSTQRMQRNFPGVLEHINATGSLPGFAKGGITSKGASVPYRPGMLRSMDAFIRRMQAMYGVSVLEHEPWDHVDPVHMKGSLHYVNEAADLSGGRGWPGSGDKIFKAALAANLGAIWKSSGHYNHVHVDTGLYDVLHDQTMKIPNAQTGGGNLLNALGGAKDWLLDKAFAVPKKLFEAAMGKIPGGGMAKMMIGGFTGKIVDAVKSFVTGHADGGDDVNMSAPGSSLAAIATGRKMAAARGWTGKQWSSLYSLWNGESGWNPRANNPSSGAYGIPQALPGSKMASAGKDWRSNYRTQIQWGMDYIGGRYGTPAAAYAKWKARHPHWYGGGGLVTPYSPPVFDQGGTLAPGINVVNNKLGKPEALRRADSSDGLRPIQVEINGVPMDATQNVAKELLFALRQNGIGKLAGV